MEHPDLKTNKKKQNPPKEGKNPCADFQWEDQSNEVALSVLWSLLNLKLQHLCKFCYSQNSNV